MEHKNTIVVRQGAGGLSVPIETLGRCLIEGGVVAFPTETVYGIGVNPNDDAAIGRIFEIKERDRGKPLTLHISDASVAGRYSDACECAEFRALTERFWPGPLTIVLPKKEGVSSVLTAGLDTVAFRFPSHARAIELIEAAGGAVAGTSANISGGFSATTAKAVLADLGGRVDYVLESDAGIIGIESTVISLVGGIKMLRRGAIGAHMINVVLGFEAVRESAEPACSEPGAYAASKAKIRFYELEEGQLVLEMVSKNSGTAAVLLTEHIFFNISPVISDSDIKKRIRVLTREGYISKVYKVLRQLDSPKIREIYVPMLRGGAVERAITNLLTM